jgi:hypothetical protein
VEPVVVTVWVTVDLGRVVVVTAVTGMVDSVVMVWTSVRVPSMTVVVLMNVVVEKVEISKMVVVGEV